MARNERRHFRRVEKSSAAGLINAIRCVLNFVCDNVGTDILIETKKKKKQQRMKEVARCNISRILRATTRTRPRVAGETISIKGQPCNVFVRYRRFLHDAVP